MTEKLETLDVELNEKKKILRRNGEIAETNDKKDDLLLKAKSLLFEQTKVNKNQEQQLEALNTQLESVKDVLNVTRNMLDIRNTEVEHLKTRLETVDSRLREERDLMERRYQIADKMYKQLRQEHDVQTDIFKDLKTGYQQKIDMLSNQLTKSKDKMEASKSGN